MKNNHIYTLIFIVLISFTGYGQLSSTGNSKGGPTYPPPTRDSETCFCFEFVTDPNAWLNAYNNLVEAQYQAFYQAQRNAIKNEIEQRLNENFPNYEQAVKELFKRETIYEFENDYVNNLRAPLPAIIEELSAQSQIQRDKSRLFQLVHGNNNLYDFGGLNYNGILLENMPPSQAFDLYNEHYFQQEVDLYNEATSMQIRHTTLGIINNNNLLADYLADLMYNHHKSYSDYQEIQQISAYLIYYANTNQPGPYANTPGLFDGLDYYSYNEFYFFADQHINQLIGDHAQGYIPNLENNSPEELMYTYSTEIENIGPSTYNFLTDNPNTIPGSASFMANSDFSPYSIFNVQDIIGNFQSGDQLVPTFASYGEDVSGQTLDRPDRIFYMQWDNDGITAGYQHAGLLLDELSNIPNDFRDGAGIVNFLDRNVPGFAPNNNIDYGKLFDFNYTGGGFTIKFSPYAMQFIIGDLEHGDGIYGWDLFINPVKIILLETLSNGGYVSFEDSFAYDFNNVFYDEGDKPLAEYDDKCEGIIELWSLSQNGNEWFSVLTLDGAILITQEGNNNGVAVQGLYEHNGITYYQYDAEQGSPNRTYEGQIFAQQLNKYFIPIVATVHSHTPCIQDGTDGVSNNIIEDDQQMAGIFDEINHYIIGCNAIAQFDGNSNQTFNVQLGDLDDLCNNIN
ncbi:hypothetical protein GCM10011344_38450 [Dokdonia pacifica]|uniref:Uncharacterized protein n=1 Tax=Dokdonia pacifica TaxID=1627892 RepID=A0A238ZY16_9FLAO|nr:hypothetical protein [Dokdonia pacifica]GGG33964.1 hypothetical protein GCM10011344_38450 [Dokdonia pacifica]SNR88275.1 hypothetical protein SAMN06265376_10421 [Dokdonia pacifica]